MINYHRRLVRRSGGDTLITNGFNDIRADKGVGDWSICSVMLPWQVTVSATKEW
jgi:hypothetical protein